MTPSHSAQQSRYSLVCAAAASWSAAALVLWCGQRWSRPWLAATLTFLTTGLPVLARLPWRRPHRNGWTFWLIWLAATAAAVSAWIGVAAVIDSPLAAAARTTAVVSIEGKVDSDVRISAAVDRRPAFASVSLRVTAVRIHHRTWRCSTPVQLILAPTWSREVRWGAGLHVVARARPAHIGARSAAVLLALEPPRFSHTPTRWSNETNRWREGLRHAAGSGEAAGLLPALAIGDTSLESTHLLNDMRVSGLSHLSAVSGANLSIVIGVVAMVATLFGLRARLIAVLCSLALVWFVAVARPSPSVLRAAAMGAIALAPMCAGWRRVRGGVDGIYALSLASCILVVIDPWLSLSYGYALSFFATLGLVVGVGPVQRWLNSVIDSRMAHATTPRIVTPDVRTSAHPITSPKTAPHSQQTRAPTLRARVVHKARAWFVGALAVSVCAQTAVVPVLLLMGARISWVALPANLLAEPAVATATISGLTAAAVSQVSPTAAQAVARPGVVATSWIATVAHHAARAAESDPLHMVRFLNFLPFTAQHFAADAVAVLCDVGQGTALVIPIDVGTAIVVDVGPDPDRINRCLAGAGITSIPLLILSHFHADHVNGLAGALRGRTIGRVLVSPLAAPPDGVRLVAHELVDRAVPVTPASQGAEFTVGSADIKVLTPHELLTGVTSPPNDDCVAVAITRRVPSRTSAVRMLAPCDLEYAGQESLLTANPTLPGAFDFVVVPHHGSAKQLEAFVAWANPRIALIPVGAHNDYGHPAADAVNLWSNRGRTVVGRTDIDGNLVVRLCGQQLCLTE